MSKRCVEIITLVLLIVMLGGCLVSCLGEASSNDTYSDIEDEISDTVGLLNGKYSNMQVSADGEIYLGTGSILEFRGNEVNIKSYAWGKILDEITGTYSIKDGFLIIYTSDPLLTAYGTDLFSHYHYQLDESTGEHFYMYNFEEGDGFIELDYEVVYKKAKRIKT